MAPLGGGVVRDLATGDPAGRDLSSLSFSCLLRMRAGEGGPGGPSGASELGRLRGVREINGLRGRIHLALRNGWGRSKEEESRRPCFEYQVQSDNSRGAGGKVAVESMRGFRQFWELQAPHSLHCAKMETPK